MRWNDFFKKAILSLACVVLWNVSLRLIYHHIPSISGERTYFPRYLVNDDDALNRYRLNVSQQIYRRSIKESDHFSPLEIRIIASDRRQNYLLQVVAFLIDAYQSHGLLSPNLELCNVEPVIFEELRQLQLHIPMRMISGTASRLLPLNASIAKEASDYWKCLNRTTKARYVMLLEDDALVVPEFAKMMASLMRQLDSRRYIDYVKLYHPNQLRKIPSIPLAIALSLIICCIFQIIAFRRVLLLWLLATCAPMYVNLRSYGSQFLADIRYAITKSVYITGPESCCTPAVVFRTQKILEMVSKLSVESTKHAFVGHAKDHILDESDFVGRQTDTNLVVHIGAVSSVRKRRITLSEVLAARNRED